VLAAPRFEQCFLGEVFGSVLVSGQTCTEAHEASSLSYECVEVVGAVSLCVVQRRGVDVHIPLVAFDLEKVTSFSIRRSRFPEMRKAGAS
jgi:hypothetical protein